MLKSLQMLTMVCRLSEYALCDVESENMLAKLFLCTVQQAFLHPSFFQLALLAAAVHVSAFISIMPVQVRVCGVCVCVCVCLCVCMCVCMYVCVCVSFGLPLPLSSRSMYC